MKILILGGGPAGLGAAFRLRELGHEDFLLCESGDRWGGLSASFTDDGGFVWDIGGHVLFSHYRYFDGVMDKALGKEGWLQHDREAWIRMQERFVPYPLQNNIHRLPREIYWECLEGIMDLHASAAPKTPAHFGEWITATFGKGLAKWFLNPYNFKVWAYPPEEMGWSWVGERVAPVDLASTLKRGIFQEDDRAWGPNATFRFPARGGTGAVWKGIADLLPPERCLLNRRAERVDSRKREVIFADGTRESYDLLFSTLPVTDLVGLSDMKEEMGKVPLRHSSTHVVGLALKGTAPESLAKKCWIYFPEDDCPFYRVTVFSNYSPENVPDPSSNWSLMCEVSESSAKPVDGNAVVEDVIRGALNTGLIQGREELLHTWHHRVEKGYPTPTVDRNEHLFGLLGKLEERNIFSRGRFGAWRYEVGNMDHSFMQGVEFAEAATAQGEEVTLWYPSVVNALHPSGRKR